MDAIPHWKELNRHVMMTSIVKGCLIVLAKGVTTPSVPYMHNYKLRVHPVFTSNVNENNEFSNNNVIIYSFMYDQNVASLQFLNISL